MKKSLLLLVLMIAMAAEAQQKIKSLTISDTVIFATVDRAGDLYIVTKAGQIQKFDKDGNLVILFKQSQPPTVFDPADGARLFAYYRIEQRYDYYTPSFETIASYGVDPAFAIQPWLMCPSEMRRLWLLDQADNSLKKLNAQHNEVEIETVIDSTLIRDVSTFTAMRDYQGFVFLLNPETGILIFNRLGQHIKTISTPGIRQLSFLGEEFYYLKDQRITFYNLFTGETRSLPQKEAPSFVLLTDQRRFVIYRQSLEIFKYKP